MDPNPIKTALSVCNQLVSKRVSQLPTPQKKA